MENDTPEPTTDDKLSLHGNGDSITNDPEIAFCSTIDEAASQSHIEGESQAEEQSEQHASQSPIQGEIQAHEDSDQCLEASPQLPQQPPLPRWYPRWRGKPVYHGNGEAFGWALDAIGRAVAFAAAGAFLFTALLRLAKEHAGCETEPAPGTNKVPECDGRAYGIKPSSLLTSFNIIVGVVSATLLPLMGAIVDYTDKRLIVGKVSSVLICILMLPSLAISSETWFPIAILQLVIAMVGWAQTMVTYAYLPCLTNKSKRLNQYTQSFTALSFFSMILVLGGVVGISWLAGFGDDSISVAVFGQSVSFVVTSVTLFPAWFRFLQPRPASQILPEGQSLWTAGFRQVWRTSLYIYRNIPGAKWFYISVAFTDAAVGSLATVAITYMTDTLAFSTEENGVAFLAILVGSIPGAFVAGYTSALWNPRTSSMTATFLFAINTIAAGAVLEGPGQQMQAYVFAFLWGCGGGWKWTTDRVLASTLIPTGQDTELMGTYLFAGQILTWLPPLVFTVMNEAGVSQRIGISTLSVWFFLGLICLYFIGDYRAAVMAVGRGEMLSTHQPEEHVNTTTESIAPAEKPAVDNIATTESLAPTEKPAVDINIHGEDDADVDVA